MQEQVLKTIGSMKNIQGDCVGVAYLEAADVAGDVLLTRKAHSRFRFRFR